MVGFFPSPYPDELLYSILARYHIWSANISPKATLKQLFGKDNLSATFDLPSHIERLIRNLPLGSLHTVESFVQQNTLFPFYAPFLTTERSKLVLESMRQHSFGDIHARVGIMASPIPQIKFFRFCPICLQEDIESYGEPYWHRIHQIIGVLVCPAHLILLQNSDIKAQGENRHEFHPADVENCHFKPHVVNYDNNTLDKLINLAKNISKILNLTLPSLASEQFCDKYKSLLIERGLATASGRVHQKELVNEFINFYGKTFLQLVYSSIDITNENNWLSSIVRKHRKIFHPLRHLLLIHFLGQDISIFFEDQKRLSHPFGEGPWVCFNGATKHYLQKTIQSMCISYSHDSKKLIGTFSCECGFVYSTTNASISYGQKLTPGKIKSFGNKWERKLKELLVNKKVSFRGAARELNVDTNTVIHNAAKLGIIKEKRVNSKLKDGASQDILTKQKEYRKTWIQAVRSSTLR